MASIGSGSSLDSSNAFNQWATALQPSNPPTFVEFLDLSLEPGLRPIASRLLSLTSGLRFCELRLVWSNEEDVSLTAALVERCFSTLESLRIRCGSTCTLFWHLHLYQ